MPTICAAFAELVGYPSTRQAFALPTNTTAIETTARRHDARTPATPPRRKPMGQRRSQWLNNIPSPNAATSGPPGITDIDTLIAGQPAVPLRRQMIRFPKQMPLSRQLHDHLAKANTVS